jgi:hypothetical protein
MATTKTTAAKTTEKKVEVKPVTKAVATKVTEKKTEVKPAAKAEPAKTEVKPAAKAATKAEVKPAAKAEPKKAETKAAPKKAETKPAAKKAAKKPAAKKENNVYVQFAGKEFDTAAIEKAVKADYAAKNGKKTATSVSIYIKPEDGKAYYVIDGIIGDVAL